MSAPSWESGPICDLRRRTAAPGAPVFWWRWWVARPAVRFRPIAARDFISEASRVHPNRVPSGAATSAPYPERRRFERRTGSEVGELGSDGVSEHDSGRCQTARWAAETFGETMIAGLGLREAVRDLAVRHRGAGFTDLEHALTSLEKTLKRLEGALMATRLVSIATVFGRFNLLVREVANAHEKRVRLVTSGGETQLDKTVIDRLGEPLVHPGDQRHHPRPGTAGGSGARREAGRSNRDALGGLQRSDRVILTVTDDGRGPRSRAHPAQGEAAGRGRCGRDPIARGKCWRWRFCPGFPPPRRFLRWPDAASASTSWPTRIRTLGGSIEVASEPWEGHQVHNEPAAHPGCAALPAGRG